MLIKQDELTKDKGVIEFLSSKYLYTHNSIMEAKAKTLTCFIKEGTFFNSNKDTFKISLTVDVSFEDSFLTICIHQQVSKNKEVVKDDILLFPTKITKPEEIENHIEKAVKNYNWYEAKLSQLYA